MLFLTHWSLRTKTGGAEVKSLYFARYFSERGWDVHYIARDSESGDLDIERLGSITVYHIPRLLHFRYLSDWTFFHLLLSIRPDVFYFRNDSPYNLLALLYARLFDKPFVHANTNDIYWHPRRFSRISWRIKKRSFPVRLLLLVENFIQDLMLNYVFKRCDALVVEKRNQWDGFHRTFGVNPIVIKAGHPIPPESDIIKDEPPVVLWIANMIPVKRPEAFVELAKRCRDLRARFVLVTGQCRPEYRRRLGELAAGLDNLTMLDEISLEESDRWFARASLYVNTSEYESIANTFIQAWLRRTPTVSLQVELDGVIDVHRLGMFSGSFEKMVADVRMLLEHDDLRRQYGVSAREYAIRHHNLTDSSKELESLVMKLMSEKNGNHN